MGTSAYCVVPMWIERMTTLVNFYEFAYVVFFIINERRGIRVKNDLEKYYSVFDEEGRLLSQSGQVEYLTTMKYIHDFLGGNKEKRVLEIGAGTGRYCIELAKEGYQVDAVELTDHNLQILKSKLTGKEMLHAIQGDALDLSAYRDGVFELTLILGPLYHLGNNSNKIRVLKEALRVTKEHGIIMAAYCLNDSVVIQERFVRKNLSERDLDINFHCIYNSKEMFSVVRIEEIYDLTKTLPVERIKILATDGMTGYLKDLIDGMDTQSFSEWMKYHLVICERLDLIGVSNHCLDILQKK